MKLWKLLEIVVKVADSGSLSEAARQLDMTPAAVSAAIKKLESELNILLFVRSTRRLRLTQEGEIYLLHCREALQSLEDGLAAVQSDTACVNGTLNLSAPSDLGRNRLLDWLEQFMAQHPDIQVRLQLTDRIANMYQYPIDLALRYGPPPDSSLVALPILPENERVLCAAPAYLDKAGVLQDPDDLVNHNCLCFNLGEQLKSRWRFWRQGQDTTVAVSGNLSADDGDAVRRWAIAAKGVVYKSWLDVADELYDGRLVRLCPEWRGEAVPLNLLCPDRRQLNPAVKALHRFLVCKVRELVEREPIRGLREQAD